METENVSYGWQGKIARVNLTTGEITTQSTDPYKYFLGGMGLANKIMYDAVSYTHLTLPTNSRV